MIPAPELEEARRALAARGLHDDAERALGCVVDYLERLERRVALLEQQANPPEPDPLVVGTEVFRTVVDSKKALRRK